MAAAAASHNDDNLVRECCATKQVKTRQLPFEQVVFNPPPPPVFSGIANVKRMYIYGYTFWLVGSAVVGYTGVFCWLERLGSKSRMVGPNCYHRGRPSSYGPSRARHGIWRNWGAWVAFVHIRLGMETLGDWGAIV